MLEEYLLAVWEAVEDDCSGITKAYLEDTLFVLKPPTLSPT